MALTENERARYIRHLSLVTEEGQEKLKNSTALVTRCGGVGGTAALYLAAAGIGRLIMIHEGNTTWSNLNRQILQTYDWVGKPRIVKIRESIHRLNPDVEIVAIAEPFTEELGNELAPQADVLLSCTPVWQERVALNTVAVRHRKPLVEAAMNGMEGTLTVIVPGETPCLRCIYPDDPTDEWWDAWSFPVLGAVAGITGCFAAIEAIKVIVGRGARERVRVGKPLTNRMLIFDTANHDYRLVKVRRLPDCPVCGNLREQK
ncbi:HesA/MoeB/ThiF family protein [Fervidibacter sacchari]|uniref:Molybdopterin/thiamine biosynthesis adenylyltransferase n=1 Tax=Candidatus Fervidibacter sacchari TaxID=1448929 RepID=A0ABT2ENC7_9BACT|nr:HesA/MoeB/ThiF family protein [Candidatus Fervidibacter sacchari]MCS3919469.1 molybdopterin/thiamine biosynthesis adenylyltransferase [Candidatus Fervidibacter sacchari]WKU15197.1 HesA/MoeB/ThiF family protein [Candidatus Fervidibacter sacchari]